MACADTEGIFLWGALFQSCSQQLKTAAFLRVSEKLRLVDPAELTSKQHKTNILRGSAVNFTFISPASKEEKLFHEK